ncbi:hypothetical protein HDU78_007087 [Chytriomyces hyalinus]|nr:hypothetical protein HDU78_007087 [Chytriomyces hyalinus]
MDRATELTDAFVETRFADYDIQKTKTQRRTLNPIWNEDFRIEVSNDADLQNEPLEIKIMDYDQITYSDAIGAVFIDLNPLLAWDSNSRDSNSITGWFPIFDSLRGICGEIFITVKIEFFGDTNRYADSSTAVQFFTSPSVPINYVVTNVLGFVSIIEREDDPEYHWADNFRTPRTSNDARMRIMYRLSGQLRRQLGKKVLELNGNAVLGYKQSFDFETEQKTITARAIGTAVILSTPDQVLSSLMVNSPSLNGASSSAGANANGTGGSILENAKTQDTFGSAGNMGTMEGHGTSSNIFPANESRSSNVTGPNGAAVPQTPYIQGQNQGSQGQVDSPASTPSEMNLLPPAALTPVTAPFKQIDQYPVTLTQFPPGSLTSLGGLVCATSVKLLDNSSDSKEIRDIWWQELRDEVKSHARALKCPLIVGYRESVAICEELVVLYCYGTAASLDLTAFSGMAVNPGEMSVSGRPGEKSRAASSRGSLDNIRVSTVGAATVWPPGNSSADDDFNRPLPSPSAAPRGPIMTAVKETVTGFFEKVSKKRRKKRKNPGCQACHITYSRAESTFQQNMAFSRCGVCKKKYVPEIILSTIEPPSELETIGKGVLVEAHVCRLRKNRNDFHAVMISESMPFAQYDIHRQLMFKLRIHGLNAIFGLKIQYSIGENLMTAVATGTAVYLKALPPPAPLKLLRTLAVENDEDVKLLEIQRGIMELSEKNRRQIEVALAQEHQQEQQYQKKHRSHESVSERAVAETFKDDTILRETEKRESVTSNVVHGEEVDTDSESDDSSTDSDPDYEVTHRQRNVVVQIDDEHDEDLVLMMDTKFREGFHLNSIQSANLSESAADRNGSYTLQSITVIRQGIIPPTSHHPNRALAALFQDLYQELQFQFSYASPCTIVGIDYDIQVLKMNEIQIRLTGVALGVVPSDDLVAEETSDDNLSESLSMSDGHSPNRKSMSKHAINGIGGKQMTSGSLLTTEDENPSENDSDRDSNSEGVMFSDDEDDSKLTPTHGPSLAYAPDNNPVTELALQMANLGQSPAPTPNRFPSTVAQSSGLVLSSSFNRQLFAASTVQMPRAIEITPLSYVPQGRIEMHLGRVSLHFVKEASIVHEVGGVGGGMGGFAHMLLAELYAVSRAYTAAMGGNAMIAFTVEESMLYESIKNQGYSLISARQITEIKDFLLTAKRKDAKSIKIKKNGSQYKFKVRCSRFLYTLVVSDADKAKKLKQSLPPGLTVTDLDSKKK